MMIQYKQLGSEQMERIKEIYRGEEWYAYLGDDEKLKRAFDNSLYTLGAFAEGRLVGLIRCVGDGEHIVLVQDLIIDKDYQKKGIGTELFTRIWNKYAHVRMFHVVTDLTDEVDNHFYRSFGMKPLVEGNMISYHRVRI